MQGKGKKLGKEERARRFTKWFWTILCIPVGIFLVLLVLTASGAFGRLPSFEELENPKSNLATEIYADDGRLLGSFFIQNRSYVDYEELSPALVAALVATEDARFYGHSGIDFISLARVAVKTLAFGNRSQGGGSTITQQLAKNLFPRDTTVYRNPLVRGGRMVVTKLKEWVTAVKLEYNYTKEEIVAMYLNTVFYGSNAYGIKAAAKTFFDKEPSELNVQEAALLVGVVNAPTRYSPVRNPERALARRNTVMTRMQQNRYITRGELDSLKQEPIELRYAPISHNDGIATYFREMVRNVLNMPRPTKKQYGRDYEAELARWESNPVYGWCRKNFKSDGTPYDIYRDGLKIYTTLSYDMQEYAEEALCQQLAAIQPRMDAQVKRTGRLFIKTSNEAAERIIQNAMRYTDRYRSLVKQGASREEIEEDFRTPVRMRIFTYKGEVDTLMTPRDSILHHKQIMRGSFMAMNPNTGHVKAYVGGPDFKYFKYDMVKQGKRHIGSTIKPFVYCFAIDYMGMTPCTMVPNLPVTLETENMEPWQPKEAGRVEYDGVLHPLRWGLGPQPQQLFGLDNEAGKRPEGGRRLHPPDGDTQLYRPGQFAGSRYGRRIAVRNGGGLQYLREQGGIYRTDIHYTHRRPAGERHRQLRTCGERRHQRADRLYDGADAPEQRHSGDGCPFAQRVRFPRRGGRRQDGYLAGESRRVVHGRDTQPRRRCVDRLRRPKRPPGDGGGGRFAGASGIRGVHEESVCRPLVGSAEDRPFLPSAGSHRVPLP